MSSINRFKEKIFDLAPQDFNETALEIFDFQSEHNPIYKQYIKELKFNKRSITDASEIPFMPIEFFKYHEIKSGIWESEKVFLSSGTTQSTRSVHHVKDLAFYQKVSKYIFESYFGPVSGFQILALLPSYQEQGDSSLICMVDNLIRHAENGSGYLSTRPNGQDYRLLNEMTILIGVTYALLDFANTSIKEIPNSPPVILETGGMKGRKREITRDELTSSLTKMSKRIFTEYGMTELFSQAYGANGKLKWPTWCKSYIRDINDPLKISKKGSGSLNVIDLANIDTCSFIETKDIARMENEDEFEVLGRMDNSDIRGCSLLI